MPLPTSVKQGRNGTYLDLYPGSSYDPTRYERPVVTVDIAILRVQDGVIKVLMIRRAANDDKQCEAYPGCLALPGGYIDIRNKESADAAALRELREETGVKGVLVHRYSFESDAERDPRWYTTDLVYYASLTEAQADKQAIVAGDDAESYQWVALSGRMPRGLAFDHAKILQGLHAHLKDRVWRYPDAFGFLGKKFTWSALQGVFEALGGKAWAAGNFRRAVGRRFQVAPAGGEAVGAAGMGRPAALFSYGGEKL